MIKSMTGFGSASVTIGSTVLATELRAVNSRFLDFKASLPKELNYLQDEIRRTVQDVCIRGWVTVTVNLEEAEASSNGSISFDRRRFEQYASILDIIEKEYECKIDLEKIIDLKELITTEPADQIDKDTVMKSVREALGILVAMRVSEGEILARDMKKRVGLLISTLDEIKSLAQQSIEKVKEGYKTRLSELVQDIELDDSRLLQEAVVLAEKADVSEECVRLDSHLVQLKELVETDGSAGKRMNFLLQEINREINTIGAKTSEIEISRRVIDMKEKAEQIKEQVQNVL